LDCLRRVRPAKKCPLQRAEKLRHNCRLSYFFSTEEDDDEAAGDDAAAAVPVAGALEDAAPLSLFAELESLDAPPDLAESLLLSFAEEDGLALP